MDYLSRLTTRARGEAPLLRPLLGLFPSSSAVASGFETWSGGSVPVEIANKREMTLEVPPPAVHPVPFVSRGTSPEGAAGHTHHPQALVVERPRPALERIIPTGHSSPALPERLAVQIGPMPKVKEANAGKTVTPNAGPGPTVLVVRQRVASSPASREPFPLLVPTPAVPSDGINTPMAPSLSASGDAPASPTRAPISVPSAPGANGPLIRVSIGRVEVRAVAPPASQPPQPVRRRTAQSLDAYLSQRERGQR